MPAGRPRKVVTENETPKALTKTKKPIKHKAKTTTNIKEAKIKPVEAPKPQYGTGTGRKYFDVTKAVKIIKEGYFYGLEGSIVSVSENKLPFKVDLGTYGIWSFKEDDLILV